MHLCCRTSELRWQPGKLFAFAARAGDTREAAEHLRAVWHCGFATEEFLGSFAFQVLGEAASWLICSDLWDVNTPPGVRLRPCLAGEGARPLDRGNKGISLALVAATARTPWCSEIATAC